MAARASASDCKTNSSSSSTTTATATATDSKEPMLLFVSGVKSGIGKSTIVLGVLQQLLKYGFKPEELAYIKPCTQCEDVQLVSKWAELNGVAHRGIGPVRFYKGFTAECIDNKGEGVAKRYAKITKAVKKIGAGKKLVLVDGVGYPAVGSVTGVSNADVAKLLNAPVLLVGQAGIGNAIDSFNLMRAFFTLHSVDVIGGVFNNIPAKVSYHTYERCVEYVTKYFDVHQDDVSLYGFIPQSERMQQIKAEQTGPGGPVACILRETKADLELNDLDREVIQIVDETVGDHFNINALVDDLKAWHAQLETTEDSKNDVIPDSDMAQADGDGDGDGDYPDVEQEEECAEAVELIKSTAKSIVDKRQLKRRRVEKQ
jgi:dethiobiotin synthetase